MKKMADIKCIKFEVSNVSRFKEIIVLTIVHYFTYVRIHTAYYKPYKGQFEN